MTGSRNMSTHVNTPRSPLEGGIVERVNKKLKFFPTLPIRKQLYFDLLLGYLFKKIPKGLFPTADREDKRYRFGPFYRTVR